MIQPSDIIVDTQRGAGEARWAAQRAAVIPSRSQNADTDVAVTPETKALLRLLAREYVRGCPGAEAPKNAGGKPSIV